MSAIAASGKGEPVVIAGEKYSVRHIGPAFAIWPDTPAPQFSVLAASTMVARPLPMSNLPSSPDLASGSWTGRLGDAGEAILTFPNATASDGVPWRSRFDPTGHLQFLEISRNGEIEFVGLIDQVPVINQQQVQVHCSDGWWLLKKAYERDWIVTQAPRDVIERATQMWVPTVADNFPASATISGATLTTPYASWSLNTASSGAVSIGQSGGLALSTAASATSVAQASTSKTFAVSAQAWRSSALAQAVNPTSNSVTLQVTESGASYFIQLFNGYAYFGWGTGGSHTEARLPAAASYGLALESDGEWVSGFVNGQLVGMVRRLTAATASLETLLEINNGAGALAGSVTFISTLTEVLQPFLQRGTDKGDYVLPGDASTYPSGGLHARYFNDNDLQSDANAISKVLAPARTNAYLGSGGSEYMNQQDPQINAQDPPGFTQPNSGAGTALQTWWSAVWFGAIYLKLSAGSYTFELLKPQAAQCAVRLWIGQTQFGQQLVDDWSFSSANTAYTFSVSATTLAGTLGYGAGTAARDGWYPIKLEYAIGSTANHAPELAMTAAPVAYTDPGGTAIATNINAAVPATSLSPLGCADQRYQGIAHFDLAQQTAQAYGYQLSVEPKQLESGLFPGVLAPRIREGHDTDIILAPDTEPRQDGENILNYSSGLDATDLATSLQGNGAGFQNGNTGQLQAMVYDPETILNSLCDIQQWTDFSDASYTSLLHALLNSQLALQLQPWQLLSADPNGSPRQSFTWPLTGALQKMMWRPGDGLRIQAPDINVFDTAPRQMLTVTRNILPNGVASTQAAFALRPRTPAHTLKTVAYKATRWARNYQRDRVALTGPFEQATLAAGATDTGYSIVTLLPNDTLIAAYLRIVYNSGTMPLHILVNGTDQTTSLNGTWTQVPVVLNILAVAAPDANGALYAQLMNEGASSTTVQYQLVVDVLR